MEVNTPNEETEIHFLLKLDPRQTFPHSQNKHDGGFKYDRGIKARKEKGANVVWGIEWLEGKLGWIREEDRYVNRNTNLELLTDDFDKAEKRLNMVENKLD